MEKGIERRDFIKALGCFMLYTSLGSAGIQISGCSKNRAIKIQGKEALYYSKLKGEAVQCELCPDNCVISKWERGFCRVRENRDGNLFTLVYGNPCAVHVDPIEKKPLFHVLPGSSAFSIATAGCNFRCKNCQNWEISQKTPEETANYDLSPERTVEEAIIAEASVIAYTYSEPVVFYEYMLETSKIASEKSIINIFHSNGFINEKPLREVSKYLKAANIDLKGITPKFYDEVCEGELEPVLKALKILKEEDVFTEITNLVISDYNDKEDDIRGLSKWIYQNLGEKTPVHFSRFYPMYQMKNIAPTPIDTLRRARGIALSEGLKYVYIGNYPGIPEENTYCHNCDKEIIKRSGYEILDNQIIDGICGFCKEEIPGIW
ncbi:MAG: AmmeMemoRadiSam system radical SAM enzyme [Actinomycetia bacterium]|nr:AmmeMemoRadiSam system radical SAM enzyme [Actinomycetes bacterium]